MNRAYRYCIYPSKEQEVLLNKTFGCIRVLWNCIVATFNSWNRKIVQEIDRLFPSSKLCGDCGAINHSLELDGREWVCTSCGCLHDRDANASRNIEVEALRVFTAQGVACA